jgi:hypothetical protein
VTDPSPADTLDDAYRIVAIHRANAPTGSVGRDWHMYRIAQGANLITGYRRGEAAAVTADVEKIVAALNERRHGRRGRVDLRPGRPAAAAPVATSEREET